MISINILGHLCVRGVTYKNNAISALVPYRDKIGPYTIRRKNAKGEINNKGWYFIENLPVDECSILVDKGKETIVFEGNNALPSALKYLAFLEEQGYQLPYGKNK